MFDKDRFRFRLWNDDEKKMHYDVQEVYDSCLDNDGHFFTSFGELLEDIEGGSNYILMQSTGIKDKRGNLLWEDDLIVNKNGRICRIIWSKFEENWDLLYVDGKGEIDTLKLSELELVGNYYQSKYY